MGLSKYQKYKLIRPLPADWPKDEKGIPQIKKIDVSSIDWNHVQFTSLNNIGSVKRKKNTVVLGFQYDCYLERVWNDPLKFAIKLGGFLLIATPDYSAYTNMEPWLVEMNVEKNLWLGATYQSLGLPVIPTVTWADERTFDICFDHIEKGSCLAISTVGVSGNEQAFIRGFSEMMRRILPSLVIVRGKFIQGMFGNLLFVDFEETFCRSQYKQIRLFEIERIQRFSKEEM